MTSAFCGCIRERTCIYWFCPSGRSADQPATLTPGTTVAWSREFVGPWSVAPVYVPDAVSAASGSVARKAVSCVHVAVDTDAILIANWFYYSFNCDGVDSFPQRELDLQIHFLLISKHKKTKWFSSVGFESNAADTLAL